MSILHVAALAPKPAVALAALVNALAVLLRAGAGAGRAPVERPFPFFGE